MLPKCDNNPVWIHAVSLGEVKLAIKLGNTLTTKGNNIFLTSTTKAGLEQLAKEKIPFAAFPIDMASFQINAVNRIRPKAVIFMETEIWPSILRVLARKNIQTFLVNARLSDKRLSNYLKFKGFFRSSLSSCWISASSEENAERFLSLGLDKDRIISIPNLKFDLAGSADERKGEIISRLSEFIPEDGSKIWIGGSIREGEEEFLLQTHSKIKKKTGSTRFIIAPRHLNRVGNILEICWSMGLIPKLRSEVPGKDWDVLVLDCFGELQEAYRFAKVAFMGGSIMNLGGQNPLEPAGCGIPVVFGSHMENFQEESKALLDAGGAIRVESPDLIPEVLTTIMNDESTRKIMGDNNLIIMNNRKGGTAKTVAWITEKM